MTMCYSTGGGALVTACTAPTQLTLSANHVGFGQTVTLSWTGAMPGAGNPIAGYEVYRDGALLGTVTQASMAVQSPAQNGSYTFTVRTKGTIPGFDSPVSAASATLTSRVTACAAPTNVRLSAYDVKLSGQATLSWNAAAGGANNPVAGYEILRDGGAFTTVAAGVTSLIVTAPAADGAGYAFTVRAKGAVAGFDSAVSTAVTLTAHAPQYADVFLTQSGTYTVPWGAESLRVCCIGGGGGRGAPGYNYGTTYPGGGFGGGGTGEKAELALGAGQFTPGASIQVTVGGGGIAAPNAFEAGRAGGATSFGSLLTARGGLGGSPGDASSSTSAPNGGAGGAGGIGGAGGGWSRYGPNSGNIGSQGANGESWSPPASDAAYYPFSDPSTGRRLGTGGAGGTGVNTGNAQTGNAALPGTRYGSGGGSNNDGNGTAGLIAVRTGRYL
ncbi:MAG TPA: hypothetical protein IAB73_05975 [Candidatus Onthenecus intestinigallinarum]|uniref:Fibronectin type-III domain-containing protein n=1 Tax=Candidatus Onthenecus intestinigallinarum TaxID=2840875 RepID=A0A9D0ZA27_9FIRM|nr:hypothetical protein [Candidatus Onthenecus intestinigallinarum]